MLFTSKNLPLSQIDLTHWQLIKISGIDNHKFLQGQLTQDLTKLTDQNYLFSAHCDPKGKVWSNILMFKRQDDIYFITRKSVGEIQVNALKKFSIFSKVTIELDTSLTIIGIVGQNSTNAINHLKHDVDHDHNCITINNQNGNNITYLRIDFPSVRYLIVGEKSQIQTLKFDDNCLTQPNEQWKLLDIEANYPIIDEKISNQYLPQSFNLQFFNAISFDKGCYCGQEIVARAQYRGINKRKLYSLSGKSEQQAEVGQPLEQKINENWRETGCVLASVKIEDQILLQAILSNELDENTEFRVKGDPNSSLSLIITK